MKRWVANRVNRRKPLHASDSRNVRYGRPALAHPYQGTGICVRTRYHCAKKAPSARRSTILGADKPKGTSKNAKKSRLIW